MTSRQSGRDTTTDSPPQNPLGSAHLRRAIAATYVGLWAERLWRAFWPLISVLMVLLAVLMMGLQDVAPIEAVWAMGVGGVVAIIWAALRGALRIELPTRADAIARLDETLSERPLKALQDRQALRGMDGDADPATQAVWQAHLARMAARTADAEAVSPDLKISERDPYALRYVAALALAVAMIFGSVYRIGSVAELTPGGGSAVPIGPSWEGWIEPPRYTGRPTLYLNDQDAGALDIPQGSQITTRFYGEVGALTLSETVSGRIGELPSASDPQQSFAVTQSGTLEIAGRGGRLWDVTLIPDMPPVVAVTGDSTTDERGALELPFMASDDYGVAGGVVEIALDLTQVDRRHGLQAAPDPREPVLVELPLPVSGARDEFFATFREDFSEHPWANLPVQITLSVRDALGQETSAAPFATSLSARRFFDPLAAAVIEQRRDLLWAKSNAPRVAQILRAVSHRPDGFIRSQTAYLRLRVTLRRLETFAEFGLTDPQRDEIAQALWDLALILEDGDAGSALERLREAQERLSEAMKNGASDEEIQRLMEELRQATNDYLQELSRQAQQQGGDQQQGNQGQNQQMQMTQQDLQEMMDRIQELMEQGRFAEAQQALEEFQQMMENMRTAQGQGQEGQNPGQQAMEDLAETLREQQGLSDEAFRELQEQFNPNAQQGQSSENEGRNGGQGRGQSHDGQGQAGEGQGDGDTGQAQSGEGGQQPRAGQGGALDESLAGRQQALRDELGRQQGNLPGAGTPEGDAARDALDRAGRAMDGAEEALRNQDFAEALDNQAEAMDALREGMQALGEQLAQDQMQNQSGQGEQQGEMRGASRDPLGRESGSNGSLGSEEGLLQGDDVYRRARELLDEIRRRSGEGERPDVELDYLRRLLERF